MMATIRSDARWIAEFRARYQAWWPAAKPLIAAHDFAAAFKTYPWPTFADAPWTPVAKPLAASTVAVVTTGGLYRPGMEPPFDADALEGDTGYRAIPCDQDLGKLAIAHAHFPHEPARADMNVIFPLERLVALVKARVIGAIASTHYSIMGYVPNAAELAARTAPAIAARMREEAVDVALLVPV